MNMDDNDSHVDGNALAGPLSTVFSGDLTAATAVCAGCGRSQKVASLPVFGRPMGLVARRRGCDHVMLRYVDLPAGRTLEMGGMAVLRLPPS